jgi:biotin carboxylase
VRASVADPGVCKLKDAEMDISSQRHVLLVGGHDDIAAHLEGLPYRFSVMHLAESIGPNVRRLASRIEVIEVLDEAAVVACAAKIHAVDPVDVIFSFTEDGLLPAAIAADQLGVKGIDLDACRMCIDKAYMRQQLAGTRFAVDHRRCDAIDQALEFLARHREGIIVKASRGAGSERVFVIQDDARLAEVFESFQERGEVFLAEEYLPGRMLSLETLTIRGEHEVASVTSVTLRTGTLIPEHHVMPAPGLTDQDRERINVFCSELFEFIGYSHGPCHIEVKLDRESIRLIEINNRVGGDGLGLLVHETTGIDCFRETIQYLYEGRPDQAARESRRRYSMGASRSFFVPVDQEAVVKAIEGMTLLRAELPAEPIDPAPVLSADDRIGPLIYVANDMPRFSDSFERLNQIAS